MAGSQLTAPTDGWHLWTPRTTSAAEFETIATAVNEFAPDEFACEGSRWGQYGAAWLKERAIETYPSIVTRVYLRNGLLEAFYGLSGATVRLTQRHRTTAGGGTVGLSPVQPATLLAWFGLHRDATTSFGEILSHAVGVALEVRDLQGSLVLVIDPFDEHVADMLTALYPFRRAVATVPGAPRRLWMPLVSSD